MMNLLTSRKGQLVNVILAMAIIFAIGIGWMLLLKPWQAIDHAISPRVDIVTATGNSGQDTISTIRKYWIAFPVVLITSTILWGFFSVLRQDPNHPL